MQINGRGALFFNFGSTLSRNNRQPWANRGCSESASVVNIFTKASDPWRSLGASASCPRRYAPGALGEKLARWAHRNIAVLAQANKLVRTAGAVLRRREKFTVSELAGGPYVDAQAAEEILV
jgi:hypothetical protein